MMVLACLYLQQFIFFPFTVPVHNWITDNNNNGAGTTTTKQNTNGHVSTFRIVTGNVMRQEQLYSPLYWLNRIATVYWKAARPNSVATQCMNEEWKRNTSKRLDTTEYTKSDVVEKRMKMNRPIGLCCWMESHTRCTHLYSATLKVPLDNHDCDDTIHDGQSKQEYFVDGEVSHWGIVCGAYTLTTVTLWSRKMEHSVLCSNYDQCNY